MPPVFRGRACRGHQGQGSWRCVQAAAARGRKKRLGAFTHGNRSSSWYLTLSKGFSETSNSFDSELLP